MKQRQKKSLRNMVTTLTADAMESSKYNWDDIPAIRTISNDIMDGLRKEGYCTGKECNKLSQDVTIKEVKKLMKNRALNRAMAY